LGQTVSYWTRRARETIAASLAEGRAEGQSGGELLARVDAAYPFGERAHWPYHVWRKERARMCAALIPPARRGKAAREMSRLEELETDMARVAAEARRST
jgi:hypothetical protein